MHLLYAVITALLSLEVVLAGGNPCAAMVANAQRNFAFKIRPSMNSLSGVPVSAWGGGGGEWRTLPADSGLPFSGRQYGGGDRSTIYGTRAYGSGYPYGANSTNTIEGRPFPYGTWPITFGNYLGGNEFQGGSVDFLRPGGSLSVVKVGSTDTTKWPGITSSEVYDMIGDHDSLLFMMADLVDWCHATAQWPVTFDPTAAGAVRPENVIQYYRASSFAMAYSAYNNAFASNQTTSQSLEESTLLPSIVTSSPFWACLNDTIGVALPIVDGDPSSNPGFPDWAVIVILFGGIFVLVFIVIGISFWMGVRRTKAWEKAHREALEMEHINAPVEAS